MKISYRNYPILEKLQKNNWGESNNEDLYKDFFKSKTGGFLYSKWKENSKYFQKEINFVCKPFSTASQKASKKLNDLYIDVVESNTVDVNFSGTFVEAGGLVYMMREVLEKDADFVTLAFYCFQKNGTPLIAAYKDGSMPLALVWMNIPNISEKVFNLDEEVNYIDNADAPMPETGIFLSILMSKIRGHNLFKKYAEVETKELKPNSKLKTIDCKYVNDTDLHLTYLDSKWFTNLVKSEAFNVRGHFRLQPFGEGLKEHKLIWISEFTKTGYTAPARKLSQDNNTSL